MLISTPVGLVKFFGNLAIMDSPQQVCETYPAFQNKVFEMALNPDPAMTGVALDTLGLLGSTVEGKQVLQKTGQSAIQRRKCSLPRMFPCIVDVDPSGRISVSLRRKVQESVFKDEPARQHRSHRAKSTQLGRHSSNSYPAGKEVQPLSDILKKKIIVSILKV